MLSVTGVHEAAEGMLTVDPYVPLRFRSEGRPLGKPITWRYTDGARNLFEFKVDRHDGAVYELTLVSSDQPIDVVDQLPSDLFDPAPGLPVVNATAVIGDVFDQNIVVKLARTDSGVFASWGRWSAATRCLGRGRVKFLIAGTSLVGVCFTSLDNDEMKSIVTYW
jgi:hypothetical protein